MKFLHLLILSSVTLSSVSLANCPDLSGTYQRCEVVNDFTDNPQMGEVQLTMSHTRNGPIYRLNYLNTYSIQYEEKILEAFEQTIRRNEGDLSSQYTVRCEYNQVVERVFVTSNMGDLDIVSIYEKIDNALYFTEESQIYGSHRVRVIKCSGN